MVEIYGYSIATVPAVVTAVYAIIELLKLIWFNNNEKLTRLIPVFSSIIGAILTVVVFFVVPELVPVTEWYSALLMGAASGLSAVGINQIKKQATKE